MLDEFKKEFLAQRKISIRVIPNAKKNEVVEKMDNGIWKIKIHAPAIEGRANGELVDFLRGICGEKVCIVSGHKNREKKIQMPSE